MTVPELDFHSTDSLVNPSKYYPAEINVPHHQLRNFISTAYENKIYFVHNFDIFVLDLKKQQRSLVATVPFEARCLAANHGWICVGGATKGDCAFVRIGEDDHTPGQYGHDLIVDMLGKDIVNSMTIHRIPGRQMRQPDEIVVLISNNDKTVTMYSLSQQEVLCVLSHQVPMNYASMSPDSTLIAAVGDSNEMYFYQRKEAESNERNQKSMTSFQEYDWHRFRVCAIPTGEGVFDDFSFAVAFSPSGQYCAVSAQGGAISVFDMSRLLATQDDHEAPATILCTFRSSRSTLWGCVRALSFSPEPWDLLAWTEDHGTIGVADIRRGFVRRQCIPLDRNAIEMVEVENTTPEEYRDMDVKERLKHQYMQRMRALRGHPPAGARSLDGARGQQTQEASSHQVALDLDSGERSVLEALETTMDDVEHYSSRPYSISYTSSPSIRPSAAASEPRREYDVQLLNPNNAAQESSVPRQRQSVIHSDSTTGRYLGMTDTSRGLMTASPAPISEDNSTPPMPTNDLSPSSNPSGQPLPYNIPPSDPWHVIEAHLAGDRRGSSQSTLTGEHSVNLARIEAAIRDERQLSNRLEGHLADERRLSASLRTGLEAWERLLEAHQQHSESEGAAETRSSSSQELAPQRQLQTEQEHNLRRSNETENEIRITSRRVERLMVERETLLARALETQTRPSQGITVPTTHARASDGNDLDLVLLQLEEERQAHSQRAQELELQVRRAESRVVMGPAQSPPEQSRDDNERISDARFLAAAARPGHTAASLRRAQQMDQYGVPYGSRGASATPPIYTGRLRVAAAARRAEAAMSDIRSTIPRTSELAGRVSENDMRLARTMLHAAVMDGNGNYIAGHAVRRNLGQQMRAAGVIAMGARVSAVEELLRDSGIGTAGLGWNLDGSFLYAGSESGIFEFKLNLQDRMQFPSLEMR